MGTVTQDAAGVRSCPSCHTGSCGGGCHAAAWVFNLQRTRTLLVHRPGLGWVVAGSGVEPGEHPRHVAMRALVTQTGVDVAYVARQPAAMFCAELDGRRRSVIAYAADVLEDTRLRSETAAGWFDLDALPELAASDSSASRERLRIAAGAQRPPSDRLKHVHRDAHGRMFIARDHDGVEAALRALRARSSGPDTAAPAVPAVPCDGRAQQHGRSLAAPGDTRRADVHVG